MRTGDYGERYYNHHKKIKLDASTKLKISPKLYYRGFQPTLLPTNTSAFMVLCTFFLYRLDSIQSKYPLDVEAAEKQCEEAVREVRSTLSPTKHYNMKPHY